MDFNLIGLTKKYGLNPVILGERRSPVLETCLGLIICHERIPEKHTCLAATTKEQGVIPLGLGSLGHWVAALVRDPEPHETVC